MEAGRATYDAVIIGGAMMGSAVAWFLTREGFDGRIAVIERDPTYANCSTAHTNSCLRQQFSTEINIRISQFGAAYLKRFRDEMGGDDRVPHVQFDSFGYLYLADNDAKAATLREVQALQAGLGAGTVLLTPDEIAAGFPFYNLDSIRLGSLGTRDEGYFDGTTMFEWWRRKAREAGVDYLTGEVAGIDRTADRVTGVRLADGSRIGTGLIVNAAGPRAAKVAGMAGIDLPVEPRKRFTWVFQAEDALGAPLPLTIDPSGVHFRSDGGNFMTGCPPDVDGPVDPDDFAMDPDIFMDKVWPALAHRVPAFERIRVIREWAGHYAYNTLDQNAVVGPHTEVSNFHFINGFSGHGFQQAPAMGRGLAEAIVHGSYQSLDLSALGFARIAAGEPVLERAVI
ncbi:MAG: FAD-binding oxidoreductase [Pseudomonadota bacterium]